MISAVLQWWYLNTQISILRPDNPDTQLGNIVEYIYMFFYNLYKKVRFRFSCHRLFHVENTKGHFDICMLRQGHL